MEKNIIIKETKEKDFIQFDLTNGLRVVFSKTKNSKIIHCGYLIDTGSRDESPEIGGMAHFIEHTTFKGTQKRSSYQILNRIETIGGELNAYTTREKTCYYTATMKKYLDRSIELLSDMLFNSTFPEKELNKEKSVIIEEIEMYEDNPEDSIYDEFHSLLFPGNSIGRSILGQVSTVTSFKKEDVHNFLNNNYTSNRIVLSIAGNLSVEKVKNVINKNLAHIQLGHKDKNRVKPQITNGFDKTIIKKFQQVHCIVGNRAYSIYDDKKYALVLLNNILGGEWMSSRLNLNIREKNAYAYSVGSSFSPYTDSGLFIVQLGTDEKYIHKCIEIIQKEFKKMKEKQISATLLNKTKRQVQSQYMMMDEQNSYIMQINARNILDYGYVFPREIFYKKLEDVKTNDIFEVANEILNEKEISTLIFRKKEEN